MNAMRKSYLKPQKLDATSSGALAQVRVALKRSVGGYVHITYSGKAARSEPSPWIKVPNVGTKFGVECGGFASSEINWEHFSVALTIWSLHLYLSAWEFRVYPQIACSWSWLGISCSKTNSDHQLDKFLKVACVLIRNSWDFHSREASSENPSFRWS